MGGAMDRDCRTERSGCAAARRDDPAGSRLGREIADIGRPGRMTHTLLIHRKLPDGDVPDSCSMSSRWANVFNA